MGVIMENAENISVLRWDVCEQTERGLCFTCSLDKEHGKAYADIEAVSEGVVKFAVRKTPRPDGKREALRLMMLCQEERTDSEHTVEITEDFARMALPELSVIVRKNPFRIEILDSSGVSVFSQNTHHEGGALSFAPAPEAYGGWAVRQAVSMMPDEAFYGFGESFASLNHNGETVNEWMQDVIGMVTSDRAYKCVPFFMSSAGYGLFLYTTAKQRYRMGVETKTSYSVEVFEDELSWFFIMGPDYKKILRGYSDLTGFAPLPPKYSFGLWMSKFGYRNRRELEEVCATLRDHRIPCDVVHLDPYWQGPPPVWSQLEWDAEAFPEPEQMIRGLNEKGFNLCLWENPYVSVESEAYAFGAERGYFVKDAYGSVKTDPHWAEGDGYRIKGLTCVDFTNPEAAEWYKGLHRKLLAQGVSVFKTDFGEGAPADGHYHCGLDGRVLHNIYPLLYNKTVFETIKETRGEPFVWARSAYAGSQRYPVHWGGDPFPTYEDMACQLRGMLSLGMSGIPFASHDIGGTLGESPPEVYIRWAQFGLFSSHSRCHGLARREPWYFGEEVEDIFREMVELRYRLLPYIYEQAAVSARSGMPLTRAMILEYPDQMIFRDIETQYMFGGDILTAPVLRGDGFASVVLPPGGWIEFWTGERLEGVRQLDRTYPLNRFPLFVREGAAIPMLREAPQFIGEGWEEPEVRVFN